MSTELYSSLDWQRIRSELEKSTSSATTKWTIPYEFHKILVEIDQLVTKLSQEEIICRRLNKQTGGHKAGVEAINDAIKSYEREVTFYLLRRKS